MEEGMKKLIIAACILASAESMAFTQVTSSRCSANGPVTVLSYDTTAQATANYYQDIKHSMSLSMTHSAVNNRPILDIRYTDPVADVYCDRGHLAAHVVIDTRTRKTDIFYGGPMVGFEYTYVNDVYPPNFLPKVYPWRDSNGLMLQMLLEEPTGYVGDGGHNPASAQLAFALFARSNSGVLINFVILVDSGLKSEFAEYVAKDPTTGAVHISTSVRDGTDYSESSQWNSEAFKRVYVTRDNLMSALFDVGIEIDVNEFYLVATSVHMEVGDGAGWAEYSARYRAFDVFLDD